MKNGPASAFPDTESEADKTAVKPRRASWLTRGLYCLALAALVLSSLGQASSMVGLATGGGLIGWAGPSLFLLVAAFVLYRIYRVLRYPQALDARPPNFLGFSLRWLAWLVMLAGAVGATSMFLIKPLTLLIFKSAGENGIGFFVVGLYATVLASVGWIGCLLFEASRPLGKRITPPAAKRSRRQWLQDGSVLAGLVVLAFALPMASKLVWGEGCLGRTLAGCAATIEGGVTRLAMAPVGAPVALQSNIDEIEFRHTGGRDWVLTERPAVSLSKSGYAVAQGAEADVKVALSASAAGKGVVVTLAVTEKGQQTALFTTRFKSGARLQTSADGKRKLVVELQRNVERPFGIRGDDLLDEMYRQMRTAIGSEREVAEARVQVSRPSRLMTTTVLPTRVKIEDARPARSCDGVLRVGPSNAETEVSPFPGSFRAQVTFLQQQEPAPTVLLHSHDRVSCHGGAIWFAALALRDRSLQIRRYDTAAALQRNLLVGMPPRSAGEYEYIDEASFIEREGQIEFDVIVQDRSFKYTRERFSVAL